MLSATLIRMTDELRLKQITPDSSPGGTQLTTVNLQGCTALTTRALHHLLTHCPSLQTLCLKGLQVVKNTTFDLLSNCCPQLTSLDVSRCLNFDGEGIRAWASAAVSRGEHLPLKELRLSGTRRLNDEVMATLGKAAPLLEVLDLSYVRDLHNSALEAFVACDPDEPGISLTSKEAGHSPGASIRYRRRLTRLRHLSLSFCILLTDIACANLAHTMPQLEFLELAGIGAELKDDGLVHLLNTTPLIRRLDLEDATDITDAVLTALTPAAKADSREMSDGSPSREPGHALEHLVISYAGNVTDDALLALMRSCSKLRVLEADNTRMSGTTMKEFVKLSRKRGMVDSKILVIDCRGVGEAAVKEFSNVTRPRLGFRSFDARKLGYVDGRDGEELKVGQDECDEKRVVLKSFYSWQTVDAVRAAREKRRKSHPRRVANESTGSASESEELVSTMSRTRWWSPSGRMGGTRVSNSAENHDREACRIM